MGDILADIVRKLYECGAINADEVNAAHAFKYDHDVAFQAKWSLCFIAVDGQRGGGPERQIFHVQRFRQAKEWLRPTSLRIAEEVIIAEMKNGAFKTIGAWLLPKSSTQKQMAAGKGALTLTVREISSFYTSITTEHHRRRPAAR